MLLVSWIDQNIETVSTDPLYIELFGNSPLMRDFDRYYVSSKKGIELMFSEDQILLSIFLQKQNKVTNDLCESFLPRGLAVGIDRFKVINSLGSPNASGGGYADIFGSVPHWIKYIFTTFSLHFQFNEKDDLDLLTISSLTLESY